METAMLRRVRTRTPLATRTRPCTLPRTLLHTSLILRSPHTSLSTHVTPFSPTRFSVARHYSSSARTAATAPGNSSPAAAAASTPPLAQQIIPESTPLFRLLNPELFIKAGDKVSPSALFIFCMMGFCALYIGYTHFEYKSSTEAREAAVKLEKEAARKARLQAIKEQIEAEIRAGTFTPAYMQQQQDTLASGRSST